VANDHTAVSRSSFVPIKNLQNVIEAFSNLSHGKKCISRMPLTSQGMLLELTHMTVNA
jgi:hypothetical protein